MLDAIGPLLSEGQANDLFKRLENLDTRSALAAEVELGLLWALSSVTRTTLHPELTGTKKRPEAFCPKLFPSAPAYVEITAVSDDTFSDRDKMERAANIISQFANRVRKGSGKHLYFHFGEKSGYENGKYQRVRRIDANFELSPSLETALWDWLSKPDWPDPQSIRLTEKTIDVAVQWKERVHPEGRTFSSMPPIAYDIEDNPVYRRLQSKRSQLSGVPDGLLKCIFLGDAGCDILRRLRQSNPTRPAVSGEQIVWHFLARSTVDIVVVFSPQRQNPYDPLRSPRIWRVTYFDKRANLQPIEYQQLEALAKMLPAPNYDGYQARSLHRQGAFDPQEHGQYLGSLVTSRGFFMPTSMRLSARLVLEYLAGRITREQFEHFGGMPDIFESALKAGNVFKEAHIESAGLDEDDDYLCFELDIDSAATRLKKPHGGAGKTDRT
jgi:hypothetical protein